MPPTPARCSQHARKQKARPMDFIILWFFAERTTAREEWSKTGDPIQSGRKVRCSDDGAVHKRGQAMIGDPDAVRCRSRGLADRSAPTKIAMTLPVDRHAGAGQCPVIDTRGITLPWLVPAALLVLLEWTGKGVFSACCSAISGEARAVSFGSALNGMARMSHTLFWESTLRCAWLWI